MGKASTKLEIVSVTVTEPVICINYENKSIGFYLVTSQIKQGKNQVNLQVYHRYQEFINLQNNLVDQFPDATFPQMPPREIPWFVDHTNPNFLQKRKDLFNEYMNQLLKIQSIGNNNLLLNFLGYYDNEIREVSLLFHTLHIGLKLKENDKDENYKAVIMSFPHTKDDKACAAELTNLVDIGDCISSINGETMRLKSFEEVSAILELSDKRPLIITFRGVLSITTDVETIDDINNSNNINNKTNI